MPREFILQFDDDNYKRLKRLQRLWGNSTASPGEVLREALGTLLELKERQKDGYTEVVLRNPQLKKERDLHVPGPLPNGAQADEDAVATVSAESKAEEVPV